MTDTTRAIVPVTRMLDRAHDRAVQRRAARRRAARRRAAAARVQTPPQLQAIANCESGGNPAAVDASGTYRGKYQFDQETWEAMGGTGDPAEAPESVQDRLAVKLYQQRGSAPWGRCADA